MCYLPEGYENKPLTTKFDIEICIAQQTVLTGYAASFSSEKVLHVKLGVHKAEIPFEELALGFAQGKGKEVAIISRIGCPVNLVITGESDGVLTASRARAQALCQENYLNTLKPGDVIPCVVTHLESFGAFCDIGCGISALLPIDCISVSRIQNPAQRIHTGQRLMCVVKSIDALGRFVLTLKELLGTWQENADNFTAGSSVIGTVRTVESYGVFVELAPNLTGLAESFEGVQPGDEVSVYIKSIVPQKMKIKLIILKKLDAPVQKTPLIYFEERRHIPRWQFSPDGCTKLVETVFHKG